MGPSTHNRIQEVKIFPRSHYSLSKIGTDVSVPIIETLFRLDLYTRETYEPGALIPFLSRPKNGRDDTLLIPPRQVSLKLNYYNKNAENLLSTYIIP